MRVSFTTPFLRKEKTVVNKVLLDEMKERGKSITDMCLMLGISRSAFYRKRNGKSEFTLSEIQKIVDYLKLDSPMDIFFTQKVS
jgi:transcriptional regulator with XRE-family HTH domain